ncbi:hypothetical protein K488DRAFT_91941 [Vararia minispora EC-137]|uniref:Uncharacterized protein n=1 Tax=Vararia minispora EC-137 TaxID=1314806 RepID=A0ACB8Q554_9AGAM|nr:hypothetical protein K488DRAFT_91941 [Vararia minispora EC-137]
MKLILIIVLTHLLAHANAHPPRHNIQHPAREPASVQGAQDNSAASPADGSLSAAINDLGGVSAAVGELSVQGGASGGSIAIVEDWKALGHTLSSGGGRSQWAIAYGSC